MVIVNIGSRSGVTKWENGAMLRFVHGQTGAATHTRRGRGTEVVHVMNESIRVVQSLLYNHANIVIIESPAHAK